MTGQEFRAAFRALCEAHVDGLYDHAEFKQRLSELMTEATT